MKQHLCYEVVSLFNTPTKRTVFKVYSREQLLRSSEYMSVSGESYRTTIYRAIKSLRSELTPILLFASIIFKKKVKNLAYKNSRTPNPIVMKKVYSKKNNNSSMNTVCSQIKMNFFAQNLRDVSANLVKNFDTVFF